MQAHPYAPERSFDGGELDCGSGLLLLIRKHIDPLRPGELLEILSSEPSVDEDLPAWCRLTGNELVSHRKEGRRSSFLVCKGRFRAEAAGAPAPAGPSAPSRPAGRQAPLPRPVVEPRIPGSLPAPAAAPPVPALAVMGVGSWPRPSWMLRALHEHLEGRLTEAEFAATADDAVRLAVAAQLRAGVDVVTDGEQRRDSYASFVGGLLQNCQLIPITDLLPYVEDPEEFAAELRALDVPAEKVRHPAVFGPLGRNRPLAVHELRFLSGLTEKPLKVALPGPYLLTRTMWMECLSDRAYGSREALATDVVRVLREELADLLAAGASLVQLDEPVLSEVAHGQAPGSPRRTFMCGALGEKGGTAEELAFAEELLGRVLEGLPRERLALHVCRGNWTPDERHALSGDYAPLLGLLSRVAVGTLVLELCTPRAGGAEVLASLPGDRRIGVGLVNPKDPRVEPTEELVARAEQAIALFGPDRVLLTPDCGFATFADNPVTAADVAERKLASLAEAARRLRARHGR